jgi:outer membrane lipoprotein-sorting protein
MTFGSRALAALGLFVSLGASLAEAADTITLDELMSERRAVKTSSAHFREVRTLAMLNQPVESTGTLSFVAPDHMERHTLAPHEESLVVDGDKVTVDQGQGKPRQFSLEDSPEMSALIESIRGTLAGDEARLARYYVMQVQGSREAWQLLLTPKLPSVREIVDSIRIEGGEGTIHAVETVEHGGDHTVMIITETGP